MKNIFKKHREVKTKTYFDIDLKTYNKILELLNDPDEYTTFNLIDLIYNTDCTALSVPDFTKKYKHSLDFLNEPIPNAKLLKHYTINNTEYDSNSDLTKVSAAQFIDFNNYMTGSKKLEDLLSVFFIPKGHQYNDGYDLNKVKQDLLTLDVPTITSFAFFFEIQYNILRTTTLQSLKKSLMKTTQNPKISEMIDLLD